MGKFGLRAGVWGATEPQTADLYLSRQILKHGQTSHKGGPDVGAQKCTKGDEVHKAKRLAGQIGRGEACSC